MTRAVLVTLATTLAFYRQNPLQALFVLIGLVLGCGLYTAVAQINASAKASYAEADQILGASAQWRITDRLSTEVAIDDYIRLRRAGFTQVYPIIERRLASADGALISIIATDLLALLFSPQEIKNLPIMSLAAGSTFDLKQDENGHILAGRPWMQINFGRLAGRQFVEPYGR